MNNKTDFQLRLLDAMKEGVWYSVYREKKLPVPKSRGHFPDEERQRRSGHPLPELPEWFYRKQSRPMRTINGLLKPFRVVAVRTVDGWPAVCKCYGCGKVRRAGGSVRGNSRT